MSKGEIVRICLLPEPVQAKEFVHSCAIVVDVLRASTTIVHALGNGAAKVMPVATIDQARSLAASSPGRWLLAGEREGVRIEGFDLGNSPSEYTPEKVRGRGIVLTTSNGTAAFSRVTAASKVLVGCLANLSATVECAAGARNPIQIVCSGDDGAPSLEDTLAAGMMARALVLKGNYELSEDDSTQMAAALFDHFGQPYEDMSKTMRRSANARNLIRLGLGDDIATVLRLDSHDLVPQLVHDQGIATLVPVAGNFSVDNRMPPHATVSKART